MNAMQILEEAVDHTGWNENSMLHVICEYVDNQNNNDTFEDFVNRAVDEEMDVS